MQRCVNMCVVLPKARALMCQLHHCCDVAANLPHFSSQELSHSGEVLRHTWAQIRGVQEILVDEFFFHTSCKFYAYSEKNAKSFIRKPVIYFHMKKVLLHTITYLLQQPVTPITVLSKKLTFVLLIVIGSCIDVI